jgi:hypothetical protein
VVLRVLDAKLGVVFIFSSRGSLLLEGFSSLLKDSCKLLSSSIYFYSREDKLGIGIDSLGLFKFLFEFFSSKGL